MRTARHIYAVHEDSCWLFFDSQSYPYQMKNLAGDPAHKSLMDGFDAQIKGWMKKTGDTFQYSIA